MGRQLLPKMVSTDQIAGFFDHQYEWKESISIFDFLILYLRLFLRLSSKEGSISDYLFYLGVTSSAFE